MTVADAAFGIAAGLAASASWAFANTSAAISGRRVPSLVGLAWWQIVSVVVTGALVLATGIPTPADWPQLTMPALAGIAAFITYYALFAAFKLGPVTVVSPVIAVNGGLTVVIALIVLGEAVSIVQGLGVLVATVGVALAAVVFGRGGSRTRLAGPGVAWATVSMVGFSVLTVAIADPIRALGWIPVLFVMRGVSTLCVLALVIRRREPLLPNPQPVVTSADGGAENAPSTVGLRPAAILGLADTRRGAVSLLIAGGLLSVLGFVLFSAGLERAPTWLVGLTSSMSPVVVVGAGIVLFGERPTTVQRLGIGLVLVGLALLALG